MNPFLRRLSLLCALWTGCFFGVFAQVNKAEYYFDTDPGFGNGTAISVTAGTDINFNFSPSISALPTGLHRLFVRALDANFKWSLSAQQLLYKEAVVNNAVANMSRLEWFIDNDPGFGAATAVSASSATDVTQSFSVPVSSLSYGLHRFCVRGQDAAGTWSLVSQQLFYREAVVANGAINVTKAEYFIDNDPGFGAASNIPLTAGTDIAFSFNPSIAAVGNGLHRLFVRVQDANGAWSLTSQQQFYKEASAGNALSNITRAEYFFDVDPGFGSATQVPVTPGTDVTFGLTGNIASLPTGLHRLFVRTQDANGLWSLTAGQLFYKEGAVSNPLVNVVQAEYFFDTDPGFGSATQAPFAAGQDVTINISGSMASLSNGLHRMFVRTRDANGLWSLTAQQLFYKEAVVNNPLPNIVKAEYFFDVDPGFGAATDVSLTPGQDIAIPMTANISALSNGLHRLFVRTLDANNKWSLTAQQLFYKEAAINNPLVNIVAAEYYFDSDPGIGSATAVSVTAGQDIVIPFTGSIASLSNGVHRLFVRTKDANGLWSLTAQQLLYKEPLVSNPSNNLMTLEYFWDTDPGFGKATKFSLPAATEATNYTFSAATPASLSNAKHNLFVRVLDAGNWGLTTVKTVDFSGIPLPLTLLDFSARPKEEEVLLQWLTTNEVNTKYFDVQRSTDGTTFISLGNVAAKGTNGSAQTAYELTDASPANGMNYYRLKQVDADGRFTYSAIVPIRFDKDASLVQLFPNPASTYFSIVSRKQFVQVEVTDMNGKVVQNWSGRPQSQYRIDGLAKGGYLVRMTDVAGNVTTKTLLVQ